MTEPDDVPTTWTLREMADALGLTRPEMRAILRHARVSPRTGGGQRSKGRYWISDLRVVAPFIVESLVERRRVRRNLMASDAGDVDEYIAWRKAQGG